MINGSVIRAKEKPDTTTAKMAAGEPTDGVDSEINGTISAATGLYCLEGSILQINDN